MKVEKWKPDSNDVTLRPFENGTNRAAGFLMNVLSPRELEVFQLVGNGCNTPQIARELRLSPSTVQTFRSRIKEKLKLSTPVEVVREALRCHDQAGGAKPVRLGEGRSQMNEGIPTTNRLAPVDPRVKSALNLPVKDSMIEELSPREREVFELLGRACSTWQIAQKMNIRFKTVNSFRGRIKEKLNLATPAEVLREALRRHDRQDSK